MVSVPASEVQKNFGLWHDKVYEGPVEITRYGRTTAYLVSAKFFREVMSSYRKAIPVEELSDGEIALIAKAKVETDHSYTLNDIPEIEDSPSPKP
jgi:hypothetical protein